MKLHKGEKLLFIGDSITDCGRRAAERPLGNGYVKLFSDLWLIHHPKEPIEIVNKGIGGDTVVGLANRWHDDVLREEPQWLSIKIGINDLHRTLRDSPDPIPPDRFRRTYDEILTRTRETLPRCGLLLIDPFYISTDTSSGSFRNEVLKLIPEYIAIVHELSDTYGTLLVKTHELFQRLLRFHEPDRFCPEPVHPHLTGHLAIAQAVYDLLG